MRVLKLQNSSRWRREYGIAIALAGDSKYVQIADITADFIYARIMGTCESSPEGYSKAELDRWAERAKSLANSIVPKRLETITPQHDVRPVTEVYLYVISGHKELNPAAAKALIERIG